VLYLEYDMTVIPTVAAAVTEC